MGLFLHNTSNVEKTLEGIKPPNYEELSKKYFNTFTEYDENFDTKTGKDEQDLFEKKILESLVKMKTFMALVSAAMERFNDEQENYSAVINMLSLYEKESLSNFVDDQENGLEAYEKLFATRPGKRALDQLLNRFLRSINVRTETEQKRSDRRHAKTEKTDK